MINNIENEIEIEWFKDESGSLNEIYQQTQMQFAFISSPKNGNKQCHTFVLCRDYLHDVLKCSWLKKTCTIYGFTFDYYKNPLVDLERTRMLVTMKNLSDKDVEIFNKKMLTALSLLNHYEKMARWSRSRLYKVSSHEKNVWMFVGTAMWMRSPFLISLYSLLIRLGDKYEYLDGFKGNEDLKERLKNIGADTSNDMDNDSNYLHHLWDKIDKVIEYRKTLFFTHGKLDKRFDSPAVQTISIFHNCSGILSLCKSNTQDHELDTTFRNTILCEKNSEA